MFVREGSGPFGELHAKRNIPLAPKAQSSVAWLEKLHVLELRPLCIHAVATDERDSRLLEGHGAPVAHCPLSNRAHRHGQAPLAMWREQGVVVGLGTDSVVSQVPLDLRAEARATGLPGEVQLELLTTGGARAIGLADDVGSLTPGAWGDVVVLDPARRDTSPANDWMDAKVRCTVLAGKVVYDAGRWPGIDPGEWQTTVAAARERVRAAGSGTATPRSP